MLECPRCQSTHIHKNGHRENKLWIWTAVDHFKPGLLGWVVGDPALPDPFGRADALHLRAVMETGQCLGVLLLRHRWIQGLFSIHPRWGSDCQQDLHDESGR